MEGLNNEGGGAAPAEVTGTGAAAAGNESGAAGNQNTETGNAAVNAPGTGEPASAAGAAGVDAHWSAAFAGAPEGMAKLLAGFGTAEEATKALERGLAFVPPASVDDVKLSWPEGIVPDAELEGQYKEFVVAKGIPAKLAQEIADLNNQMAARLEARQIAAGDAALQERYGADVPKVKEKALTAFTKLDRKMNGELSSALGGTALMRNAKVAEAFYHISQMLGEDSLGNGTASAGAGAEVSEEQFYKGMFPEGVK